MEDLTLRHQNFLNAYSRLEQVIKRFNIISKSEKYDEEDIIAYRDSVIKRFEFCYDLFWKLLKSYLELQHHLAIASPKKVFHACFENNIIHEDDTRQLLNMADDRNYTSHTYNEILAEEVSHRIIIYAPIMKKIISEIIMNFKR